MRPRTRTLTEAADVTAVTAVLPGVLDEPRTVTELSRLTGLGERRTRLALDRMVRAGHAQKQPMHRTGGAYGFRQVQPSLLIPPPSIPPELLQSPRSDE